MQRPVDLPLPPVRPPLSPSGVGRIVGPPPVFIHAFLGEDSVSLCARTRGHRLLSNDTSATKRWRAPAGRENENTPWHQGNRS